MGDDYRLPTRVLVVSSDSVGSHMAGPAIRAFELAKGLALCCNVTLAAPHATHTGAVTFQLVSYAIAPDELKRAAGAADAVLVQGVALDRLPWLAELPATLIIDLYDPFHLENLQLFAELPLGAQRAHGARDLRILNAQLDQGDFFICATERQRDFWLGMLSARGRLSPGCYARDPTLRRLIDVVPFGLPTSPPIRTGASLRGGSGTPLPSDAEIVLWGGGLWDWLDPITLIHAFDTLRTNRPRLHLYFMGCKRPNGGNPSDRALSRARELTQRLQLTGRVIFNDWVPYNDRASYLLEADIGASLHGEYLEARYAFRTRILDYIWADLPVLCTLGDETSAIVERFELGTTVQPGDVAGVACGIERLLNETVDARLARQERFRLAREQLDWDHTLLPLRNFLAAPEKAPHERIGTFQERTTRRALSAPLELLSLASASYRLGGAQQVRRDAAAFVQRFRSRREPA